MEVWERERGCFESGEIGFFDLLIDLVTINRELSGCLNADPDEISIDFRDVDFDLITDHDAFVKFTTENEHNGLGGADRSGGAFVDDGVSGGVLFAVGDDDLFPDEGASVDDQGADEIDRDVLRLGGVDGGDIVDEGVFGIGEAEFFDIFVMEFEFVIGDDIAWGDGEEVEFLIADGLHLDEGLGGGVGGDFKSAEVGEADEAEGDFDIEGMTDRFRVAEVWSEFHCEQ